MRYCRVVISGVGRISTRKPIHPCMLVCSSPYSNLYSNLYSCPGPPDYAAVTEFRSKRFTTDLPPGLKSDWDLVLEFARFKASCQNPRAL